MMKMSYYQKMLTTSDMVATPFYIIFLIIAAFFIRSFITNPDDPFRKYFIPGLLVKFVGAIMVGVIYFFYYHGGDTTEYYNNAIVYYQAFSDSPYYFFKLLMSEPDFQDPAIITYKYWMYFHKDNSSYFFSKISGILTLPAFNIYTPTALIMAFVSYGGVWALYATLCKIYPEMYKKFAFAVLFVPSVFFWGSGMLKDTFTFSCVGWMTYTAYNIFFLRKKVIINSIVFLITAYICLRLKAYIVFSMIPALVFWVFLNYRTKIESPFLRLIMGPVAVLAGAVFGILIVRQLGSDYAKYSLQSAVKTAESFQQWHGYLAESGNASGYSLGTTDGTFFSILSQLPAATNVTLFRPYLWETRNPVMLLSAFESTCMMLFAISIFWKTGIRHTFRSLAQNPTAFFCIFFSIFFAFCVGFSAYNFGALVRYKIPCIPFFVAGLLILNMQTQADKAARKAKFKLTKPQRFAFDAT